MPAPFPTLARPFWSSTTSGRPALLYRVLTEEGYRVFEAASAEEAMSVLDMAHRYVHLIMLDVVMPDVDGVSSASAFSIAGRRSGCSICRRIPPRCWCSMG